jgi:hypothetical protein
MAEEIEKFKQDEFRSEGEVEKAGAEQGFIPNQRELIAVAKYWANYIIESDWICRFMCPTSGRQIDADKAFANRRMHRISKLIGDELVDKAWEEANNDFSESMTDELWAVFEHGDDAQREAVAKEAGAMVSRDEKRLASLTYLTYPESRSPDRTKKVEVPLTPKELADLEAASRSVQTSPAGILRKGAALYVRARSAKRKSSRKGRK